MALNLAIKAGSTFTSIYVEGYGLVLREPTVVAFEGSNFKKVCAVGREALEMQGKTPNMTVIMPVQKGMIVEPDAFCKMMNRYLDRIYPVNYFIKPRMNAVVVAPIGMTIEERESYENAFMNAGVNSVTLAPAILLSALGADKPITTNGSIAVNIGGGHTEIASLSNGGIIKACGVNIGGEMLDSALLEYFAERYGLKVDKLTARNVREQIGSLYENDIASMVVSGMDIKKAIPASESVCAVDIMVIVKPYFIRICSLIKNIIKSCPEGIASDVLENGIILTGGVTNIAGINKMFGEELSLPIHTFNKPEYMQILGGGKLLSSKGLIERLRERGVL